MMLEISYDFSLKHQLAIISSIRKSTMEPKIDMDVLTVVPIIDVCGKFLSIMQDDEEVYFLKLEVFWILCNLAAVG